MMGCFERLRSFGYQERKSQQALAKDIESFMKGEGGVFMGEAPTGTGKTFAYLIPILVHGKRAVIATYTKSLQEQLVRDIEILKEVLGIRKRVAVRKGVSSYVCMVKLDEVNLFEEEDRVREAQRVYVEAQRVGGDLDLMDIEPELKEAYSVRDRDECEGCTRRDCYYMRARIQSKTADIVVMNHHSFMTEMDSLGDVDVVVIDEAHEFPETFCSALGVEFTERRIRHYLPDVEEVKEEELEDYLKRLREVLRKEKDEAYKEVRKLLSGLGRANITEATYRGMKKYVGLDAGDFCEVVIGDGYTRLDRSIWRLMRRVKNLVKLMDAMKEYLTPTRGWVSFRERGRFRKMPLFARVPEKLGKVVFVSATLDREYMELMLSLEEGSYIYKTYPKEWEYNLSVKVVNINPRSEEWEKELRNVVEELRRRFRRVMVLLTSREHLGLIDTDLKQGLRSFPSLIREFREKGGVLAGVDTFWKGIDVPGDKAVVIGKLPFRSPEDKIHALRCEFLEKYYGEKLKWRFIKAQAKMDLKQGIGRLKRREEDTGEVWLLDNRVFRPFFKEFLPVLREYGRVEVVEHEAQRS